MTEEGSSYGVRQDHKEPQETLPKGFPVHPNSKNGLVIDFSCNLEHQTKMYFNLLNTAKKLVDFISSNAKAMIHRYYKWILLCEENPEIVIVKNKKKK